MLKRAYNWLLKQAERPYALWVLSVVSFAESSFFPIPPDPLYLAMLIAKPKQIWRLAFICTLSSVAGGVLGYYIGYGLYETWGLKIIEFFKAQAFFTRVISDFNTYGFWIIAAKGLTPIPYKIVTIASGVAHVKMSTFITASIIARGFRFFSIAVIVRFCGPQLKSYLDRNITLISIITLVGLIVGFLIVGYYDQIGQFFNQLFS